MENIEDGSAQHEDSENKRQLCLAVEQVLAAHQGIAPADGDKRCIQGSQTQQPAAQPDALLFHQYGLAPGCQQGGGDDAAHNACQRKAQRHEHQLCQGKTGTDCQGIPREVSQHLHAPAAAFGIALVHAQQVTCEEGGFIATRAGTDVQQLEKREKPGRRYPSYYYPDRVAAGIISADYAVYRQAPAMVFLHHNSNGNGWRRYRQDSIILANRHNGVPLAQAIADSLNSRCLNHGMPNKGKQCKVEVRYRDASRGGGWLNVCDDAGIPAAIIEAAFLNNRQHARYLADPENARRYAEAVGHGIVHYLRTQSGTVHHRRHNVNEPDEGSFGYALESRRLDVPGAKLLL